MILDRLRRETDINVMCESVSSALLLVEAEIFISLFVRFVESVCNDETIIEANIRLKLNSPDYMYAIVQAVTSHLTFKITHLLLLPQRDGSRASPRRLSSKTKRI